jgi:type VI secretion system protein ImpH
VAGEEVWDPQARVRVRLGPLTRRQYDDFLPFGTAYGPLRTLTRFFCGEQFDFEVQLVLARDEVPPSILGGDGPGSPLGWCTWMRSQPFSRNADDTILTL